MMDSRLEMGRFRTCRMGGTPTGPAARCWYWWPTGVNDLDACPSRAAMRQLFWTPFERRPFVCWWFPPLHAISPETSLWRSARQRLDGRSNGADERRYNALPMADSSVGVDQEEE